MSSSSSQPAGLRAADHEPAPFTRSGWRKFLPLLTACFVLLTFLTLPFAPPSDASGAYEADVSLSMILNHAHQQGLQSGTDHVYTYGPLGYLIFFLYPPDAPALIIFVHLVLCLMVASGLCLVAWRLGALWGPMLVGSFIWVAANNQPRTDLVLNAGLLCWGLLCFVESGRRLTLAVSAFTALVVFSALAKNSFLLIGGLSVVLVACDLLLRRHRRHASGLLAGFGLGFLLGWVLAGQNLLHLPAFITNVFAMVQGYNAALGWEALMTAGRIGGLFAFLATILIVIRTLAGFSPEDALVKWRRIVLLVWISALSFVAWKHGFVRAHPCNLEMSFGFLAVLALAINVIPCESVPVNRWARGLSFACWLLPLVALSWLFFPPVLQSLGQPARALYTNLGRILNPAGYRQKMAVVHDLNRWGAQLPVLTKLVGDAPIDVFGRRQAFAFYNNLNYRPRPSPQSYAVCNAELMRLNQQFFLSDRAPEFVLFELKALDRKFPVLEDAWALRHLLINYEPVGKESAFILLKAKSADPPALGFLQEDTVRPGEHIDLRGFEPGPLWIEIALTPTWSGWLRQFFLRPPPVRLAAWEAPGGRLLARERAPAPMLSAGFLASPLLRRTEDLLSLYAQTAEVRPGSYSVELLPGHDRFWREIRFRIYKLANPIGHAASTESVGFLENWKIDPELTNALPSITATDAQDVPASSRPFTIFRNTRWRPTQPPPGNFEETLTLVLFMFMPVAIACGLIYFALRVKHHKSPVGWRPLVLGNALVLSWLLSVALLAGEIYFRFFYDSTDSLGYTRVCERWVERHWHVNKAGCRDNIEYAPAIQPDKRRITFIGDSFTAGHGIKNVDDRFPNRLRKNGPRTEVHVLANVGLDTGSELILLNRALRKGYELDEVVLVYCLNDIGDVLPAGVAGVQLVPEPGTGSWFVRNSYLINFLYHRYKAARNPAVQDYFPHLAAAYRGTAWESQKQRLKDFRDLVHSHGGRLSVVTFPFLHALGSNYDYQFAHGQLGELWRELEVPHLDLLPAYRNIPPAQLTVNAYDAHPNEYANKIAARELARFLSVPAPKPVL